MDPGADQKGDHTMDSKLDTVQAVYAAFGRGDVPAILRVVTDDVDWASEPESTIAPWHGIRRGTSELPGFFQALDAALEVTEFTPLAFATSDTDVMAVIRFGVTARATAKSGAMDLHHWWRFRDDKISWYRGTENTALTAELLKP
jgi:ketosteroid isomerase-like protein